MSDFTDRMLFENRNGAPDILAKVAETVEAAGLEKGAGAVFVVWNGEDLSAYTFGDDEPLKVYGALSLLQKSGLINTRPKERRDIA